jgi:cation diffusion facilitator CzcD-associated flavoprotein CzcO
MTTEPTQPTRSPAPAIDGRGARSAELRDADAIVIGAGFAGLCAVHHLVAAGFSVRAFEAGPDVGGTWFWNRYPGARCDVESADYSYSFDPGLEQQWTWTERFSAQPEILAYLRHVADRFDLRRHIEFGTRVVAARYDDQAASWQVTTDSGRDTRASFCFLATGSLSVPQLPDIPGLADFAGAIHHSCAWPDDGVPVRGRRVGVIGTGSSGVQLIPVLAEQAGQLTVFQRTPAFSVPARNRQLTVGEIRELKQGYRQRRAIARGSPGGIARLPVERSAHADGPAERQAHFEARWRVGGTPSITGAYSDLLIDVEANRWAADFVRDKIRARVTSPEVAAKLVPSDFPIGTKRVCADAGYFETFDRPNVKLVDLRATPLVTATRHGLRTSDSDHTLDLLVCATGFDAFTGAVFAIDICGAEGRVLREHWASGPRTYLGLATAGFPNLFLIAGPGSPAVLTNVVASIEQQVDWLVDYLRALRAHGRRETVAREPAEAEWGARLQAEAQRTLYPWAASWYNGANTPGKPRQFMVFLGGLANYARICDGIAEQGYPGFRERLGPLAR